MHCYSYRVLTIHYLLVEVSTPLVMSVEEGAIDGLLFCLTVTEARESYIFREYMIESIQESAKGKCQAFVYADFSSSLNGLAHL